jgi:hypothetical protein
MKRDSITRIVSVCVQGKPAKSCSENAERTGMVRAVADEIERAGWGRLDAVLFPGGFFYTDVYTGDRDFEGRRKHLESSQFSEDVLRAFHKLAGCYFVSGVDSAPRTPGFDNGDEFCVAWKSGRVQSLARKIFPTKRAGLTCYAEGFDTSHRLIELNSGRVAVLCACYDVYGCEFATPKVTKSSRPGYITRIVDSSGVVRKGKNLRILRTRCVENFAQLVRGNRVSVCLGAVHRIEHVGGDNYWERFGVANCSAALRGLCICATHYCKGLPDPENPRASTLAACDVPARHLTQGHNRRAHRIAAANHLVAFDGQLLVRLFEC